MDPDRQSEFLQRLALTAAQTLDATSLVRLVINETTGAMGVDVCSVYLLDAETGDLVLAATNGLSQAGVGRVRLLLGEGVTGAAAEDRRPVVVPDVRDEPRFRWLPGVDQARFVSMCSVPIVSAGRLVGVLNVQTDVPRRFSDREVGMLVAIAAQVAGALERSALLARLEAQVADLRRSEEIHRRFTDLSLRGAGLEAICAEIALQADARIALYDDEGERLAPARAADDDLPARLPDPARAASDRGLVVREVRAGTDVLGWLAVRVDAGTADTVRRRAFEHGVTVLALELSRERAATDAELRLRGDVVEELLASELPEPDAARLVQRAARLGYRLRSRMWVVVVEPDDPSAARTLGGRGGARRLLRAVTAVAGDHREGTMVVARAGTLTLLVPDPGGADEVERLALAVITAAGRVTGGGSFSAGVSGGAGGPARLHRLAEEARMAMRVGRRLQRSGEVSAHRRLGAERLLLAVGPDGGLREFVDEWLGPLERVRGRSRAGAPLVETLDALAAARWSPRAAADRLNVHVNTLLYRLQRVRELTGRDLDDPDVRLSLALALRARTLIGDMDDAARETAAHAGAAR